MSNAQRRWPPIVAAIVGAILVFLVLPNPLSVPQNNPSASAEYAPVPGKQEEAQSANFSQTNTASSSGIGAGDEGIGALPGIPPPKLPEFKPRQKNCVGNPPRQTEDPLSPPCVPFFEGKNGGGTYQGVTKDEIVVILYNDRCCDGELKGPWKPSDEDTCTYQYECEYIVRTVKAQLRYFQQRYQTYGRTVRLIAQRSTGNIGGNCASRQSDAKTILDEYDPFAVVFMNEGNRACYMDEMLKNGVAGFGTGFTYTLDEYQKRRPHVWGFFPGLEIRAKWGAGLLCDSLQDQTAKYAGDPAYHDLKRTFGLIRPSSDSRGPEYRQYADLLEDEVQASCGKLFDKIKNYEGVSNGAGAREANGIMSEFKRDSITSVLCICIEVPGESTVPIMQKAATALNYKPEWVWTYGMTTAVSHQTYGNSEHASIGVSTIWRQPAFREQFHYQAYLAEEPGSEPNVFWNFNVYTLFLNLFQGIQGAGPNLTLDTVEKGMYTFNWTDRNNPWVPTGGYGSYGRKAIGPFNFIDTAVGWWYDPSGTPPGRPSEGCMRLILQGRGFYHDEWPKDAGEGLWFRPEDPCTENVQKIADASVTTGGF